MSAPFRGHLDALIDDGVHGVVPGGSTGEVMTLDADEYHRLIELTVEHVAAGSRSSRAAPPTRPTR